MNVLKKNYEQIVCRQKKLLGEMEKKFIANKKDEYRTAWLGGVGERFFNESAEVGYVVSWGKWGWRAVVFKSDGRMLVGRLMATKDKALCAF